MKTLTLYLAGQPEPLTLDLSPEQKLDLFDRGVRAGERFLDERHGPHGGPSGPGAPAGPR